MTITSRQAALAVLVLSALTILGALMSQHVFGLVPCELCLQQRWPYYGGVPLALATWLAPDAGLRRLGLLLLALVFLGSAAFGAYHAGVEWKLWAGPAGCSGGPGGSDFNDFLKGLDKARAVSCTDAAWRLFGISLAGWNAVASVAIAALAFAGWRSRA